MGRTAWIALTAALLASPAAAQTLAPQRPTPVVVELFTAQGCAECAAADAWAALAADRRNLIVLSYPVDYWDYLGWKDTHADPAFAARQRAYKQKLGWKDVYTPQIVIDGRMETPADDPRRLTRILADAPQEMGPRVTFDRSGERTFVRGGAVPPGGAEVWMVRYDPGVQIVKVTAGENAGVMVMRRNTVRELRRLGPYTGRPRAYALPEAAARGLRTVVIVQSLRRGGVLAAGRDTEIEPETVAPLSQARATPRR